MTFECRLGFFIVASRKAGSHAANNAPRYICVTAPGPFVLLAKIFLFLSKLADLQTGPFFT